MIFHVVPCFSEAVKKFHPRIARDHLNHHHGQDDWVIHAKHPKTGNYMGHMEYSEYRGKAHIGIIKVHKDHRRRGIGTKLYRHLHKHHRAQDVRPGLATSAGHAMVKAYHKKYPDG